MRSQIYTLKDIRQIAVDRQNNKFDFNIAVSGERGNGKSTFLFKLFNTFPQFRPKTHIVYRRREVMDLLEKNKFGVIMDDEAIRTGYKRNFYDSDQKTLVQMMNMYRDNFNVYGMAIPNFYSLDKDVRDLIKMHIQIVDRGLGVIHVAQSSLYSDDKWDVAYNKKIEERWAKSKKKNARFKPPYHKLSTFMGYIKFGDLTIKQRELYEEIKAKKRKEVYEEEMKEEGKKESSQYERLLEIIMKGGVSKEMLIKMCLAMGVKFSLAQTRLNQMLTDLGEDKTLKHFLIDGPAVIHSSEIVESLPKKVIKPVI